VLVALLSSCQGVQSALSPKGSAALDVAGWWWIMFWIAVVVFAVVLGLLLIALFRTHRRAESNEEAPKRERGWLTFVVIAGAIVPAAVLLALMAANVYSEQVVEAAAKSPALTIEIIGHQWWWEVHYPQADVTTANEIHIPAGKRVNLKLTSADVIHSFWAPELAAKTDLIPGRTNTLTIEADHPGIYRGQCAEFCGVEHANMAFLVIADAPDAFKGWLARQQKPAPEPATPETKKGEQVFQGSACVYCHTVRGTNASSDVGPDLTHLASRHTLAAGTLTNTRANLAGWIVNSQAIKPGNKMPPMYLNPSDLQALLAYLETLK
jgi:cytochrome c oxidase subunit 2